MWCINLNTGDVFTEKRWKEYYDAEKVDLPNLTKKKEKKEIKTVD